VGATFSLTKKRVAIKKFIEKEPFLKSTIKKFLIIYIFQERKKSQKHNTKLFQVVSRR